MHNLCDFGQTFGLNSTTVGTMRLIIFTVWAYRTNTVGGFSSVETTVCRTATTTRTTIRYSSKLIQVMWGKRVAFALLYWYYRRWKRVCDTHSCVVSCRLLGRYNLRHTLCLQTNICIQIWYAQSVMKPTLIHTRRVCDTTKYNTRNGQRRERNETRLVVVFFEERPHHTPQATTDYAEEHCKRRTKMPHPCCAPRVFPRQTYISIYIYIYKISHKQLPTNANPSSTISHALCSVLYSAH